jgi:hypothetical protein
LTSYNCYRTTFEINKRSCFIHRHHGRFPISKKKPFDIVIKELIEFINNKYGKDMRNDIEVSKYFPEDLNYLINYNGFCLVNEKHFYYGNHMYLSEETLKNYGLEEMDNRIIPLEMPDEEKEKLLIYKRKKLRADRKYWTDENINRFFHNGIPMGPSVGYRKFLSDCKKYGV